MLPQMDPSWPIQTVGNACEIIMGQAPSGDTYNDEGKGMPLIAGAADLGKINPSPKKWTTAPTKVGEVGDIILCVRATIGDMNWADNQYCYGRGVAGIRANSEKVLPEFAFYWLQTCKNHLQNLGRGATFKQISKTDIATLPFPNPNLSEQRRIVARIKECMELVDEIETLRANVLNELHDLPSALIESELRSHGGIPEFPVGKLVTKMRNGRSISPDHTEQANGAVLTLTAVQSINLGINFKKPIVLPEEVYQQFSIQEDDVFVSRANTIELVGLSSVAISSPTERLIYPDLLIKLRVDREKIIPRYLAYALRSNSARRQIKDRALGSSQTMVKISGKRLRSIVIPVPTINTQKKIVEQLDSTYSLVNQTSTLLTEKFISTLRESILRKAFAGEF